MQVADFNEYTEIFCPLPEYEQRKFPAGHYTVCYGSHRLALAKNTFNSRPFILVQHGGGREVWEIRGPHMNLQTLLEFCQRDEAAGYALLYAIYQGASEAYRNGRDQARRETAETYRKAFVDGRLKKRKLPRQDAVKVWIEAA